MRPDFLCAYVRCVWVRTYMGESEEKRTKLKKHKDMQTAGQTQMTMPPFGGVRRNAMPRLSKEEISARFISADASRQSVLRMVKRFYENKQA